MPCYEIGLPSYDDLVVFEYVPDILDCDRAFHSGFALVDTQASCNVVLLVLSQPLSLLREAEELSMASSRKD